MSNHIKPNNDAISSRAVGYDYTDKDGTRRHIYPDGRNIIIESHMDQSSPQRKTSLVGIVKGLYNHFRL